MKADMKPSNVKNKLVIFIIISNIITFLIIYFFNINSKNYDEINNYIINRNNTDKELRSSIVELQNKITNLPKLFTVDRREVIINRINNEFTVEHTEIVRGRDNYNSEFSRLDKKDISSGKIVANIFKDNLFYSYGLLNTQGEFSEEIKRNKIYSKNPQHDIVRIQEIIKSASDLDISSADYEGKIATLKRIATDSSFEAEQIRMKFLGNENDAILADKTLLENTRKKNDNNMIGSGIAVACNVVIFLALTGILGRNNRSVNRQQEGLEEVSPST